MTNPIVPQQQPAATSPLIEDCGICGQSHACHSPHLKSYCDICVPPTPAAVRNVVARALSEPESEYLPVIGLTPKGVLAATRYRRRQNLIAVSR